MTALRRFPAVGIEPTLEHDARPHKLSGPRLTTVLAAAGVRPRSDLRIALRASTAMPRTSCCSRRRSG